MRSTIHKHLILDDAILNGDSNEENKGMALVNLIDIKKQNINTFLEFASAFVSVIIKESQGFSKVKVIFDKYEN